MDTISIKRALLSVFDKTGIVELAKVLHENGVEIISTGGTAKALRDAGINTIELSDYTGFPEILDGRVKTLHPKIHGGLLYVRGNANHEATVAKHDIGAIDLVVVNLYPFEATVASGASKDDIIEKIDIGGPSMLRSAAKNHIAVAVVVDPQDYESIIESVQKSGGTTLETRQKLAGKVFATTAHYDTAIARYFNPIDDAGIIRADKIQSAREKYTELIISEPLVQKLRYGENPHQSASLFGHFNEYYKQLHGKELSYNNILDLTAATDLIMEFENDAPTVAILKHTNPCGVGRGASLHEAWGRAFATDTQAPFGGVIATNTKLDIDIANAIKEIFCEIIVAPDFSDEAMNVLSAKKNLRLIKVLKDPRKGDIRRVKSVGADSFIVQDADLQMISQSDLKVVTKRAPTQDEMRALLFGWKVVKHVKSNAIVYAGSDRTLGVGAGQMSRVDSSRIAVWKAGSANLSLLGSVVASDAFFPFPDGLIAAADAGATAVIQPGGSVKDTDVIASADLRNMAMVFTGTRHFRH